MKKKPLILHIESATGICSTCISCGSEILDLQEAEEVFQHSNALTKLINKCLNNSGLTLKELDAVALSSGPGSYTSLRVGASTAKGICYALDKPLISVDTLQSLALSTIKKMPIKEALYCPMIDARRMEVYCNVFDSKGNPLSSTIAKVIDKRSFEDYFNNGQTIVFCGNGADKCRETIDSPCAIFDPSECSAAYLPELALHHFENKIFEDTAYFIPLYLKPPNITFPKNMNLLKA